MINNYMMSSSAAASPFPVDRQFFVPNYQSSASLSSHVFFNPTQDQAAAAGYNYPSEMHHSLPQQEDHVNAPYDMGSHDPDRKKANYNRKPMKLRVWKNENSQSDEENPVEWMSSKMRLMQKMKNSNVSATSALAAASSSSPETHHFSNNSSFSYNVTPVRVCADCNTTQTPLWRSGPKGPKSLCNACGIRQRKARRAMAAAAVANGSTSSVTSHHHRQPTAAALKIMKVQNKEKTQLKKRCNKLISRGAAAAAESSHHAAGGKKSGPFEDFLFNLSKNLAAFHRVFPQDEKEAAILLMALSCGLVHG